MELAMHNVVSIKKIVRTITRSNGDDFDVINIFIADDKGAELELTCYFGDGKAIAITEEA